MVKKQPVPKGTIYGNVSIIEEVEQVGYNRFFLCECLLCGNTCTKNLKDLSKEWRPRTCGKCNYRKDATMAIPGEMYFGFKFIKELPKQKWNRRALVVNPEWQEVEVSLHGLVKWVLKKEIDTRVKHGMHTDRFYKIYNGIVQRCINEHNTAYDSYGGRGIQCLWWSFQEFKDDMYVSYLEHSLVNEFTSIDRIDTNGNYCKDNCKWATMKEQWNNKRNNIEIPKKYGNKTLLEICSEFWILRVTLVWRLLRWMSFEDALNHKKGKHSK